MKVIIYSTPNCPLCLMAKNYFKDKNIPFEEVDVSVDQKKAEEMIKLSGQLNVPVIAIDDKVITGFDEEEIEEIIKTSTK